MSESMEFFLLRLTAFARQAFFERQQIVLEFLNKPDILDSSVTPDSFKCELLLAEKCFGQKLVTSCLYHGTVDRG